MALEIWGGGIGNFTDPNWNDMSGASTGAPQPGDSAAVNVGRVNVKDSQAAGVQINLGNLQNEPPSPILSLDAATIGSLALAGPPQASPHAVAQGTAIASGHDTVSSGINIEFGGGTLTVDLEKHATLTLDGTSQIWSGSTVDIEGVKHSVLENAGTMTIDSGSVKVDAVVRGHGLFDVAFNPGFPPFTNTLEFGAKVTAGETVNLASGILELDKPRQFLATITGFNNSAHDPTPMTNSPINPEIELVDTTVTSLQFHHNELTAIDGCHVVAKLHLVGNFTSDQFTVTQTNGNAFIALTLEPPVPLPAMVAHG